MKAWNAVRGMMDASGVGPSDLSRRLGRSRSYITASVAQGSVPKLDTFARIAHECGYRVMLQDARTGNSVELYSRLDARDSLAEVLEKAFGKDGTSVQDAVSEVGDSWSYETYNATGVSDGEISSRNAARSEHLARMNSDAEYRAWYERENARLSESGVTLPLWYLEWARKWDEQQRESEREFFRLNNPTDSKPE